MGSWLIKDGCVDDLGLQILYLEAIEPGLHHQILCDLRHFLRQYDHSKPYQVKDIMDTAYYFLDPQTFKLYPRAEVPQLSTPEHLASEAKNPFLKAPACPVNSHPPEAPKPHTPQVAHLIPGSHVPAHPIHAKPSRQYHPVAPHPPKAPTLHNP